MGKDTYAQQASLAYEMRKVNTEEQAKRVASNFRIVAQGKDGDKDVGGGWKAPGTLDRTLNDQEAFGEWIGASFEHQGIHLEYKSTDWKTGKLAEDKLTQLKTSDGKAIAETGLRGGAFVDEAYEKKGSYSLAQMGSNTVEQLKEAHNDADRVLNDPRYSAEARNKAQAQKQKVAAIAETFMSRYGSTAIGGAEDQAEAEAIRQNRIQAAHEALAAQGVSQTSPEGQQALARVAAEGQYSANTAGAAHVAERVVELAQLTGVYRSVPRTPDSTTPHAGNPNQN